MKTYFSRMKSTGHCPPRKPFKKIVWSWIGSFIGIFLISYLGQLLDFEDTSFLFLIGSFGASAVLIYGAYKAPLAQPRNVLLGHFLGALMGVAVYDFFGLTWWTLALAVTLTIVFMMATYSMHPPAGATAYVAIQTGGLGVGYAYIINPVLLGAFILLVTAIIINKAGKRDFPASWW